MEFKEREDRKSLLTFRSYEQAEKLNAPINQTIRSTLIMGGSSVINVALGIVRYKVIALLLNPAGLGLEGVFRSISALALTIFGMGISESGARQVALAYKEGNSSHITTIHSALKRIALLLGILGTGLLLMFRKEISFFTFQSRDYSLDIALLSFTIILGTISGSQIALLQGARKISSLAKINVLGPIWGTLLSVPIIFFLRMRGIVSYLLIMAATNLIASWWYSRKIQIPKLKSSWAESFRYTKPLVGLGTAFMIGTLIAYGTSYIIRFFLIRNLGLDSAGHFQASVALSYVYAGLIFKAMGTDYYPRLSRASGDVKECNAIVNEQIEVGLLLALPGIIATITFAPQVLMIFYSSQFLPAVEVLRWQILGVLLQLIAYPLGYVLRAKGAGTLFMITELFGSLSYLGAAWIGVEKIGLPGIGVAYFIYNALYLILIIAIVKYKYGIIISNKNTSVYIFAFMSTSLSLVLAYLLPSNYIPLNALLLLVIGYYSYKKLNVSTWVIALYSKFKRLFIHKDVKRDV